MVASRLGQYVEKLERNFEVRFESVARDPRLLAFVASSINLAAFVRIENRKLKNELTSLRARLRRGARG